jgi:replication factor C subunit 3/5
MMKCLQFCFNLPFNFNLCRYHVEMNPSDVGTKDRYVVQEVIKDMAKSRPIDAAGVQGYKVLVLNEVDRLSKEAQHGLRRTMEKYSAACRLILICNSVSKVLDAVRSRCLPVRVSAPRPEQIEAGAYTRSLLSFT